MSSSKVSKGKAEVSAERLGRLRRRGMSPGVRSAEDWRDGNAREAARKVGGWRGVLVRWILSFAKRKS